MTRPSDQACTPRWLCDLLPSVSLDPCSNPVATVRAEVVLSLEAGDDGLARPWRSLGAATAFVNWPYSNPLPWARRCSEFVRDGGSAIVLAKLDPTTRWWRECFTVQCHGWVLRDRLRFEGRIWSRKRNEWRESVKCNFPSVLLFMGPLSNFRGWSRDPLRAHVVAEIGRP